MSDTGRDPGICGHMLHVLGVDAGEKVQPVLQKHIIDAGAPETVIASGGDGHKRLAIYKFLHHLRNLTLSRTHENLLATNRNPSRFGKSLILFQTLHIRSMGIFSPIRPD
jgi:hypothetical protein